jgi:hypothetical protein
LFHFAKKKRSTGNLVERLLRFCMRESANARSPSDVRLDLLSLLGSRSCPILNHTRRSLAEA